MSNWKWEKTKVYPKRGFDKPYKTIDQPGPPVNRLSNKLGAEAFWPTTLDKESDKAARILRSFCKDGFYAEINKESEEANGTDSRASSEDRANEYKNTDQDNKKEVIDKPKGKQRVVKKIPPAVIKQAKGLAIFTAMRTGLWFSGSGGGGILVARIKETGEWSPPSGIMMHTVGLGFLAGVDIYDCVVVINTYEALEAFKAVRRTLGGELSPVAGPFGIGGAVESEVHKRRAPVWTYLKSRGVYAGVQMDETIVIERTDENERFYGERIRVADILAGKAKNPPASIGTLIETIKAAQGDADVDETMLPPPGEAPGDADIETDLFGVPPPDDPDPFGVKALEREGVIIREAGTNRIPSDDMFEFRPSPTSPLYNRLSRFSMESSQRASWRTSVQSTASADRATQTDDFIDDQPPTVPISTSRSSSDNLHISDRDNSTRTQCTTPLQENTTSITRGSLVIQDQSLPGDASQARPTSPTFTRARLVTIAKPIPPPLPPRNTARISLVSGSSSRTSEREAESQIERYEDVDKDEVHGNSNDDGKGTKPSSVGEGASSVDGDSLNKCDSIQDTFKKPAITKEIKCAEQEESSTKEGIQLEDVLQESTFAEEDSDKNLTEMQTKEEDTVEDASLKGAEPIVEERSGGGTESTDEAEFGTPTEQPQQEGSLDEDKEEFHSISTSPTPPKTRKKPRNRKKR
ncbi:DUF500 domain-containing protein [Blastomyces gilchristii SLH14081]|uniref:DUF500 domain-containing protein n=1 Tax=Blastomyces gilchristii (strain SLH14081) TaxID=559298 RepID=A0A179UP33_BLAGS|nr:DUF500 domain-containing protein [Blastomyces gilchristii SLH14081]OAT08172.1 DUF500 domain-containing protein [Blastomyces gilchristii SLH14081]